MHITPDWLWVNTDQQTASLNMGGMANGSFNDITNAFNVSWTRTFTAVPFLRSESFSFQGSAQLAAVLVPAAILPFASALTGVLGLARTTAA